jgi:hypothetical protein
MATSAAYNTVSPSGSDGHWKVAASTSAVLVLSASQSERAHASIFNHSNASLFIKFGSSAGVGPTGLFDHKITSGTLYELPKPTWQGEIWGAWDATGGFALVLELGDND